MRKTLAALLVGAIMMGRVAEARPIADETAIANAAGKAMAATGAKGLAIALIDKGRVKSVQTFGLRNAQGDPLTRQTIMYGASLTKVVFAYAVMKLVDEGKIDLDKPIAHMLPKPLPEYGNVAGYGNWGDLAGDDRWKAITPRIILTHSIGFANFAFLEPDGKLRIHFDPGSRYSYSGEGIILLQFAIEKGLGIDMGPELDRLVFDPLAMPSTALKWRADFAANLADGWTLDGTAVPHDQRGRVRTAGSMDTTITDLAKFTAALVAGAGLNKSSRAEMAKPLLPIRTASQFPVLAPDVPADRQVKDFAAGIGLVTFKGPQGRAFARGGHNDSTGNIMVCVEQRQRCVLIMSNDVRAEAAFPMLVRTAIGETGLPWRWIMGDLTFVE